MQAAWGEQHISRALDLSSVCVSECIKKHNHVVGHPCFGSTQGPHFEVYDYALGLKLFFFFLKNVSSLEGQLGKRHLENISKHEQFLFLKQFFDHLCSHGGFEFTLDQGTFLHTKVRGRRIRI